MNRPLTPHAIGTILGAASIVLVALLGGYLYLMFTKVAEIEPAARKYGLASVESQLNAPDEQNVFLKTAALPAAQQGDASVITYQSSEIGKEDLTQLNK